MKLPILFTLVFTIPNAGATCIDKVNELLEIWKQPNLHDKEFKTEPIYRKGYLIKGAIDPGKNKKDGKPKISLFKGYDHKTETSEFSVRLDATTCQMEYFKLRDFDRNITREACGRLYRDSVLSDDQILQLYKRVLTKENTAAFRRIIDNCTERSGEPGEMAKLSFTQAELDRFKAEGAKKFHDEEARKSPDGMTNKERNALSRRLMNESDREAAMIMGEPPPTGQK